MALAGDALGGEDVDEHHHEQQVDEVHGLHQADRQEEVLTGLGLNLGLPCDGRDGLRTGQAVADRGTDGAPAQCEAAADEGAGDTYRTFNVVCCHVSSPLSRSCFEVFVVWSVRWPPGASVL